MDERPQKRQGRWRHRLQQQQQPRRRCDERKGRQPRRNGAAEEDWTWLTRVSAEKHGRGATRNGDCCWKARSSSNSSERREPDQKASHNAKKCFRTRDHGESSRLRRKDGQRNRRKGAKQSSMCWSIASVGRFHIALKPLKFVQRERRTQGPLLRGKKMDKSERVRSTLPDALNCIRDRGLQQSSEQLHCCISRTTLHNETASLASLSEPKQRKVARREAKTAEAKVCSPYRSRQPFLWTTCFFWLQILPMTSAGLRWLPLDLPLPDL